MGFCTLSSKAGADQKVLVDLFNGYVTFFAYEILGLGTVLTAPRLSHATSFVVRYNLLF